MVYVMSGPRGNKESYENMMSNFNPSEDDAVFVLGNIIGEGGESMALLDSMLCNPNIFPVLGESEYYAKRIFPLIKSCMTLDEARTVLAPEDGEILSELIALGCEKAVSDFLALSEEKKDDIIYFFTDFQCYEELEAGGRKFVLAYGGIEGYEKGKELEDYDESAFVLGEADYTKPCFDSGEFLVSAKTPSDEINPKFAGRVYSSKKHLVLNCATDTQWKLGGICLDTLKVYYS